MTSTARTSTALTGSVRTSTVRLTRVLVATALVLLVLLGAPPGRAEAASTKPSNLVVSKIQPTSVTLSWDKVAKAPAYKVKYSRSKSMSDPTYVRTTTTSATLPGLKAGTAYYLKVRTTKASGASLSGYSAVVKVTTATVPKDDTPVGTGSAELRVASYNVTCDKCFDGQANELHWSGRRDAVAASIKAQDLDVIGVQEASQGWLKDSDGDKIDLSQFEDLRNALGGSWTLTNSDRNNCVKSKSPNSCDYKDQGASDGDRILFDASRVTMLEAGSKLLPNVGGNNDRYVTWARLKQRSTGKQFMYASTHLEPAKDSGSAGALYENRRDQAEVVAETVAKHNPEHLPAFIVGDMNSTRFAHDYSPTNAPYDVYTKAGYVDPLGGAWRTTSTAPGALVKHRVNTWLNSFNGFDRKVEQKWVNGSYIDYIMVSKGVQVPEWETVANRGADGNLVGIIPSDHNMIRATVVLPA
jgi:endonuclease/exonuclease/phosphatase family metal-dependent hydrolase